MYWALRWADERVGLGPSSSYQRTEILTGKKEFPIKYALYCGPRISHRLCEQLWWAFVILTFWPSLSSPFLFGEFYYPNWLGARPRHSARKLEKYKCYSFPSFSPAPNILPPHWKWGYSWSTGCCHTGTGISNKSEKGEERSYPVFTEQAGIVARRLSYCLQYQHVTSQCWVFATQLPVQLPAKAQPGKLWMMVKYLGFCHSFERLGCISQI